MKESPMPRYSFTGKAALVSMALGTSVAIFNMFYWDRDQYYFAQAGSSSNSIPSFYLAQSISIFLLLLGFYLAYQYLRKMSSTSPATSLLGIIGSAISDKKLARAAIAATALYGIIYALASSIVVFQPGVDFSSAYDATAPASWSSVPCCGDVGTLPKLILYLSPAHLAVQLVPLSVLLLFIVPPLVGLNLSIALFSVRRTVAKVTGRWMVACGAAVGLFTACPTCAGFFLAESIGGIGATTLAVALAPYQALFIAVSIPLLVAMPFLFASRVRWPIPRLQAAGSRTTERRSVFCSIEAKSSFAGPQNAQTTRARCSVQRLKGTAPRRCSTFCRRRSGSGRKQRDVAAVWKRLARSPSRPLNSSRAAPRRSSAKRRYSSLCTMR